MGWLKRKFAAGGDHGRGICSVKTLSLVILSVQTSTMVLVLRYSRTASSQHYVISTAVLLSEILKFLTSVLLLHADSEKVWSHTLRHIYEEVILNILETIKMAIPACLYVIQNNLLFIALSNLEAATYQVTYQLKILTTALFSWVMLGKQLRLLHWCALCLLMLGVSLVQVDVEKSTSSGSDKEAELVLDEGGEAVVAPVSANAAHPNQEVSWLLGILAVLVSCISSGFSGVYFERLVKQGHQTSLIIRNIQLGIFSMVFAVMAVCGDWSVVREAGFFQGYTPTTWVVVFIQAFGGLMVSVTMKYADNILKGFATSLSIVMSSLVSWAVLGDAAPSLQFVLGAGIVIGATVLYGVTPQSSRKSPSASTANSTSDPKVWPKRSKTASDIV
ncbi:UDP-galactose transporter [Oratosquilla oratoria]|uniref:UDP-galactose transporter n=1 Tax=Oratosquilla oratoria TaxID=337810 RepID=UPI003F77547D